jgi:K+-sensing histidine kinase KdpD
MLRSAMTSNPDPAGRDWGRRALTLERRIRPVVVVGAAVIAPLVVTAVLLPFRGQLPDATVALGLAVLVSLLASIGTRITAVIAAVSAAVCFDLGFTQPYGSLAIAHPQDVETTVLLLIGGLIVGQLSARNRSNRQLAAQTGEDLGHIQAIAETMAAGAAPDEVVAAVAVELESLLGLRNCWFETSQPVRPVPTINRNGDVSWGRNWWGFDSLGLPGKEITLEVEHDQRRLGRFVLVADPGTRVRRNQLLAAVTLAEQAGAALGAGVSSVTLADS